MLYFMSFIVFGCPLLYLFVFWFILLGLHVSFVVIYFLLAVADYLGSQRFVNTLMQRRPTWPWTWQSSEVVALTFSLRRAALLRRTRSECVLRRRSSRPRSTAADVRTINDTHALNSFSTFEFRYPFFRGFELPTLGLWLQFVAGRELCNALCNFIAVPIIWRIKLEWSK